MAAVAKKKGLLSKIFNSSSKGKKTVARPKGSSRPKRSATSSKGTKTSRPVAQKKQIKKPSSNKPTGNKQSIKMELIPVTIKDHRDKNGGHHHIILEDIDNNHVSVGLTTHQKKGKNSTNYTCKVSPLGDGKASFMRRQAQVAPMKEYYNPQSGNMEKGDYERAKVYGNRAKEKYLAKKR